jgi:hypothetical protein
MELAEDTQKQSPSSLMIKQLLFLLPAAMLQALLSIMFV